MSRLEFRDFQTRFVNEVLEKDTPSGPQEIIIKPARSLDEKSAFAVYRNGYYCRLTEAMAETFKGVQSFLGEDTFIEACEDYITKNPSTFHDLSDYGANFPIFLKEASTSDLFLFLSDLARFEWEFKNLFHKRQHRPVDLDAVTNLSQGADFRIRLGGAVTLYESDFKVYEAWKLRNDPDSMREGSPQRVAQKLVMYKKGGEIFIRELGAAEFECLVELGVHNKRASEAILESGIEPEQISRFFEFLSVTGVIDEFAVDQD